MLVTWVAIATSTTTLPFTSHPPHPYDDLVSDATHGEVHRQITSGWIRAGIFGVSDGLVTNISLILGFAGANPGHAVVRLAGLAGLVAGGFSMATGEYVSMRAQKELLEYEIEVERQSIAASPEAERVELRQMFEARGVEPSATGSPWGAASSSLGAFALGAFVPLLPWLWSSTGNEVGWSILFGAVGSLGVGGTVGWFTHRGIVPWALRQLAVTALAAAVMFGFGRLVGA